MKAEHKACEGAQVLECGDMAECIACGDQVRWDLREHPFWGFQHCRDKPTPIAKDCAGSLFAADPLVSARNV